MNEWQVALIFYAVSRPAGPVRNLRHEDDRERGAYVNGGGQTAASILYFIARFHRRDVEFSVVVVVVYKRASVNGWDSCPIHSRPCREIQFNIWTHSYNLTVAAIDRSLVGAAR